MKLGPKEVEELRAGLCAWFVATRRDLPWRRTRDPYAIWISEAMLQQTRVEAVIDHYHRFLARFPTVQALAASTEDEVVAAWSGLGYYRRARALREAARVVVEEHAGVLPSERDAFRSLPGVGPYTAGAVLSIAYQRGEPLVDGNVVRVFTRLFGVEDPPGGERERLLWSLAAQLVPPSVPADEDPELSPRNFNQALMELGALICTPRSPRCLVCPVASSCRARVAGNAEELPKKAPKRAPVDVELEIALVRDERGVLLVRRPAQGRMAGMWELPTRENAEADAVLLWPARFALEIEPGDALVELRHGITHHRIRATVQRAALKRGADAGASEETLRFVQPGELEDLGLTGLTRKALRACEAIVAPDEADR